MANSSDEVFTMVDVAAGVLDAAKERRREHLIELRRAGWTYPRLAEASGLSLATVWRIAHEQGGSHA